MENRTVNNNITIKGVVYQINKTTPRTACWLFCFLGSRADGSTIMKGLGACSQLQFAEIQDIALKLVFRMVDGFPIAVIAPDGTFTFKDLENEPEHVFRLTTAAIGLALEPFLPASDSSSPTTADQDGK